MTVPSTASVPTSTAAVGSPWTCPFCPLLCDGFELAVEAGGYALRGSDCPRAQQALRRFTPAPAVSTPTIDGRPALLPAALDAAAAMLAASRQPLFGGLGTDVDGARALYALACATGAISDAAGGDALLHGLRALQDRGAFTTTLAEVRNRADLIVCVGPSPREALPEFWRRVGIGRGGDGRLVAQREIVYLGAPVDAALVGVDGVAQRSVALAGDLFDTVALLSAAVAERQVHAPPEIAALAERLRSTRYAVLVWQSSKLPAQGTLIVEALNQIVATLNRKTRAALLPLGGADGLATVNYVHTWLSGLPLRSRAGPLGLEHEPLRFDAAALLASGAVDALLWVASFGTEPAPPPHAAALPTVVLGGPGVAPPATGVFIPAATPGIGQAGHLFRADGGVELPLTAARDDGLPGVAEIAKALTQRVRAAKTGAAA